MNKLDYEIILNALPSVGCLFPTHLYVHQSIDSTNAFLKKIADTQHVFICCAEEQTKGRGRFTRAWHAPANKNIALSISYPMPALISLNGFSLAIGLAILEVIQSIAPSALIKWPNDIVWEHQKLAGILIETKITDKGEIIPIIGIGINVNSRMQETFVEKKACSLYDITGNLFDRNQLIIRLFSSINSAIHLFLHSGFHAFQERFKTYDYLYGQLIQIKQNVNTFEGYAKGITEQGLLILEDKEQNEYIFSSGDSSIIECYHL